MIVAVTFQNNSSFGSVRISRGRKKKTFALKLPPILRTSQLKTKNVMPRGARSITPDRKALRIDVSMFSGVF